MRSKIIKLLCVSLPVILAVGIIAVIRRGIYDAPPDGVLPDGITCEHIEIVDPAVEATCTKTGFTEGKHCSVCAAVLQEQEEIPALGHKLRFSQTVVPTVYQEGELVQRCDVCSIEEVFYIPKRAITSAVLTVTVGSENYITVTAPVAGFYRVVLSDALAGKGYVSISNSHEDWRSITASKNRIPSLGEPEEYPLYVFLYEGSNTINVNTDTSGILLGTTLTMTHVRSETEFYKDIDTAQGAVLRLNKDESAEFTFRGIKKGLYFLQQMMKINGDAHIDVAVKDSDGNLIFDAENYAGIDVYVYATDKTDGSSAVRILAEYGLVYIPEDGDYTVQVASDGNYVLLGTMYLANALEGDFHDEHEWQEATCSAPKTCSVCGYTVGEKMSHVEELIPAVAATCTATGLTEGIHCSACSAVLVAQEETPVLNHTYVDKELKVPTFDKEGEFVKECLACGATDTLTIPVRTDVSSGSDAFSIVNGRMDVTVSESGFYHVQFPNEAAGAGVISVINVTNEYRSEMDYSEVTIPAGRDPSGYPLYIYLYEGENVLSFTGCDSFFGVQGVLIRKVRAESVVCKGYPDRTSLAINEPTEISLTGVKRGFYFLYQILELGINSEISVSIKNSSGSIVADLETLSADSYLPGVYVPIDGTNVRTFAEYGFVYIPEDGDYTVILKSKNTEMSCGSLYLTMDIAYVDLINDLNSEVSLEND